MKTKKIRIIVLKHLILVPPLLKIYFQNGYFFCPQLLLASGHPGGAPLRFWWSCDRYSAYPRICKICYIINFLDPPKSPWVAGLCLCGT